MPTKLKDSSGNFVKIQAGESCNLTGTLKDTSGSAVTPATLTLSLFDHSSGVIVNSRKEQNVLNANGGTVTDGVYTIELDESDTAIVGNLAAGSTQDRVARITYTWDDGDAPPYRTGVEEFLFPVESMKTALGGGSGSSEITITLTDSSSNPVGGANVYLTSDLAGSTIIAGPVLTNDAGVSPTLSVEAGGVYRWASKEGFTFTNPQLITVT